MPVMSTARTVSSNELCGPVSVGFRPTATRAARAAIRKLGLERDANPSLRPPGM
jgi:hypothetical protein